MRQIGLGAPLGGLAIAVVAFALWLSALPLRWLDALVVVAFIVGLALSVGGFLRGRDTSTRRLAVVGIGCNSLGLLIVALLYATG
jgi:hypothetical protein